MAFRIIGIVVLLAVMGLLITLKRGNRTMHYINAGLLFLPLSWCVVFMFITDMPLTFFWVYTTIAWLAALYVVIYYIWFFLARSAKGSINGAEKTVK